MQRSAILFGLFGTPPLVDTWTEPSFFLGGSVLMPSMIWQTMSLGACFGEMDKLMSRLRRSLGCKREKSWQFPNQKKIVQVAVKYMMKDDLPWNSSPQRTWFPAFVLRNPSMQLVILIHYLLWKDNRFWKPLPGSRPVGRVAFRWRRSGRVLIGQRSSAFELKISRKWFPVVLLGGAGFFAK